MGLLSILDGMLALPMREALAELPLPDEIKQAIETHQGDYGAILEAAKALESGRLQPRDEAEEEQLLGIFLSASETAFAALHQI